jgi:hypothetical protein
MHADVAHDDNDALHVAAAVVVAFIAGNDVGFYVVVVAVGVRLNVVVVVDDAKHVLAVAALITANNVVLNVLVAPLKVKLLLLLLMY